MWLLILGGLLSLLVGSFLNVVIYRVPLMLQRSWQHECALILEDEKRIKEAEEQAVFNLMKPGSHCPQCNCEIKPWQNIPILSYLIQKGKCADCKTSISARYPLVELTTALLSLLVLWTFGNTAASAYGLILCWSLIALTMIDVDHQLLPDNITLPLVWLGLIANVSGTFVDLETAVWGAVAGYLSLWSVFWLFKLLTGKDGMGYGDFKLLAALGAWLGWQMLPLIIILSSLVGAILGSLALLKSKQAQSTPIPFGPYLAVAGGIAMIWGDQIVQAYLNYSGL
ncbi:MAG: A24 family peptidase [Pseudomonadales bacterium]